MSKSKIVCFQRNERVSCDEVCPNDGYLIILLAFFTLVLTIFTLFSKRFVLCFLACFYKCFPSRQLQTVNQCLFKSEPVDKQIQCDIDYGLQTVTIHPDNSICILTEFDFDEI